MVVYADSFAINNNLCKNSNNPLTEIEAVSGVVEFLGVEEDEAAAGELAAE